MLSRSSMHPQRALACIPGLPLVGLLLIAAAQAQAPVETAGENQSRPAKGSVEQRLNRVERLVENRSLLELAQNVSALREEVRLLRGQLDQQQHQLSQLQQKQQDIYEDLDRRVQVLSKSGVLAVIDPDQADAETAVPGSDEAEAVNDGIMDSLPESAELGMSGADAANTASPTGIATETEAEPQETIAALEADPLRIASEYDQAFSEMRSGNYRRALSSFSRWLENYPEAPQRANALFWKAEVLYIQEDHADAVTAYQELLQNYPGSHKREQAMLKMGYSEDALGNSANAIEILEKAARNFPNSAVSQLAQKRIGEIRSRTGTP